MDCQQKMKLNFQVECYQGEIFDVELRHSKAQLDFGDRYTGATTKQY